MLITLLLFWVMLSGSFSPFFISASFFSSVVSIFIIQGLFKKEKFIIEDFKNWSLFIFKLFKEIGISSWNVTKLIWFNVKDINQCYSWVDVNSTNHNTQVIFSSSITLTPGTMSLEVKDNMVKVHSLLPQYLEGLHQGDLNKCIIKLEHN